MPANHTNAAEQASLPAYKPYKRQMPHSYLAGSFPVQEWLRAGKPLLALLTNGKQDPAVIQAAEEVSVPIIEAPRVVERLAQQKGSCQVIGVLPKSLEQLQPDQPHLVLHEPADFGNLGTIIRCAAAFNLTNLAIIGQAADHWHPQVLRASMGAVAHVAIATYSNMNEYRDQCSNHLLYPFMLQGSLPLHQATFPLNAPVSLVFGNEARGLPEEGLTWGQAIRIEQSELVDSLNLANSVAIAAHYLQNNLS